MSLLPTAPRLGRGLLYLTVFTGGMTTLAVEFTASRLLQTTFGTSNLIWANVVGLMLIYLTVGYFLGGRIADRFPTPLALFRVVTWGAFLCGLVPLVAQPVIKSASQAVISFQAGAALASFIVVLVLFSAPIVLLGCISPFAIRLALEGVGDAGRISGQMYGVSTLGSIVGTFLPVLLLWDAIGVALTFMTFAGLLMIIGLWGLGQQNRRALLIHLWMPVVLIIVAILTLTGPLRAARPQMSLLWEKESAYNFIQVQELNATGYVFPVGTRMLYLNEGQGIHSVWHPQQQFFGGTWDMFLAAPYFNADYSPAQVQRLCVVGLAAGTISTQYTEVYGERVLIDGIEIDPAIVDAGRRFFGMTQPNLTVIVEDGRLALMQAQHQYDVIAIDAYRVPYVPWHLTTREFFAEAKAKLTANGVVVINVGRAVNMTAGTQDRRLVEAMTATMLTVFPTVHTIDVPQSFNTILIATAQPTTREALSANLARLGPTVTPLLRQALQSAVSALRPTEQSDLVFTDDRAPVESIINSMLIDFLLGDGASQFSNQ